MSHQRWIPEQIFVYQHPVDMRKQIDDLAIIVTTQLGRDPAERCLSVFSNRGRNNLMMLIWHMNGYWLLYKRLEKQRFHWPDRFTDESVTLTQEQLDQLRDGSTSKA